MKHVMGQDAHSTPTVGHEHILFRLLGDSPTGLFQGKGPTGGRWLALHHRVKNWSITLHRVREDSVFCQTA
jgi:hypothetical protein